MSLMNHSNDQLAVANQSTSLWTQLRRACFATAGPENLSILDLGKDSVRHTVLHEEQVSEDGQHCIWTECDSPQMLHKYLVQTAWNSSRIV
jgi:hypothetical protein